MLQPRSQSTEPWPEAVNGDELLTQMVAAIRRHVMLSDAQDVKRRSSSRDCALALAQPRRLLHSHALDCAEHSPRLHIASPEKRCGKTVLLRTLEPIVPRALTAENITTSALFRVIERAQPTLLIDEADAFLTDNEELRGVLNASHARNGNVIRTVGDDYEPRSFRVWGAVVIAGIGRIPQTLEDRSITVHMRRRLPGENIVRLKTTRREHLAALGRKAARWVADNEYQFQEAGPALPEPLGDRQQDNWRPLIAIADAIGPAWGEKARGAAMSLSKDDVFDEPSAGVMVLEDVCAIFDRVRAERLSSQTIVDDLVGMPERPWAEWRRGQPLNPNSLARLLKPFGIKSRMIRFEPKPANPRHGYQADAIREAKLRFVDRPREEVEDAGPEAM